MGEHLLLTRPRGLPGDESFLPSGPARRGKSAHRVDRLPPFVLKASEDRWVSPVYRRQAPRFPEQRKTHEDLAGPLGHMIEAQLYTAGAEREAVQGVAPSNIINAWSAPPFEESVPRQLPCFASVDFSGAVFREADNGRGSRRPVERVEIDPPDGMKSPAPES